jgi:hypothetical protein
MKISCHKSQTSIKNYSSKTSDDKLEKMGKFLHRTVVGTSTVSESAETNDQPAYSFQEQIYNTKSHVLKTISRFLPQIINNLFRNIFCTFI